MNARAERLDRRCPVLLPEFERMGPAELAVHFRTSGQGRYFPVVDAEATTLPRIDGIVAGRFEFNHETHVLAGPMDWLRNPSHDLEWHILLHKFYYAVGLGMAYERSGETAYLDRWVELTDSWIDQVEPGYIASDVTGRRIQNWIYAFHFFVLRAGAQLPPGFLHRFLESIDTQVGYLGSNLAPARNHRTLELYAIFLASVAFPELRNAGSWRAFAFRKLLENLHSDLLPDGVHIELSTDYHHIVLRNFLCVRRLAAMNDIEFPADSDRLIERALEFSMHVHRPDGVVPSFSDGDARSYLDLLLQGYELYGRRDFLYVATAGARGEPPRERCRAFQDSGYVVQRSDWGGTDTYRDSRHLVFDCGPVGAGNHGHFDLLSFEASAYGRSLVVDPGRYTYDESGPVNWRVRFRGTGYHNTVQVDGSEQVRYRPGRRKYRIAGPHPSYALLRHVVGDGCAIVHGRAASHEYDAVHERCIFLVSGEYWVIADRLDSPSVHTYEQLFHLAAGAWSRTSLRDTADGYAVDAPGMTLLQAGRSGLAAQLESGFVSASYGHKSEAPVVRFCRRGAAASFDTVLVPFRDCAPRVSACSVAVTGPDGVDAPVSAACHAITKNDDTRETCDLVFLRTGATGGAVDFGGMSYDGNYLVVRIEAGRALRVLHIDPGASLDVRDEPLAGDFRP